MPRPAEPAEEPATKRFAEIKRFFEEEQSFEKKITSERHRALAAKNAALTKRKPVPPEEPHSDDEILCLLPEGCDNQGPYECGGYCYCPAEYLCQGSCPVVHAEKEAKVLSYSTNLL